MAKETSEIQSSGPTPQKSTSAQSTTTRRSELQRQQQKLEKFDQFNQPKHGYDNVNGDMDSPTSFDEIERPPLRHVDKYCRAQCLNLSARYTVAFMAMMGFIISFGMKCNLSAAKSELYGKNNTEKERGGMVHWDAATEGMVDSSFFWGYLVTQIPGGFLASFFPANRIFGVAIITSALLNMTVPGVLENLPMLITIRIMQGLVEGVAYPACHGIWRFWAPPAERSRLATIAFCGSYAGIVIGMPISGFLAQYISWKAPFYFYSIAGIVWYCGWLWLVFERPRVHPTITIPEMKYIEKSLGENTSHTMPTISSTPFEDIAKSMPVYAIIVANFCRSWNFYMLVLYQSKFMEKRFGYNTSEAGLVSALPHLVMTMIVPFGGVLADHLRKTGAMSTTSVRKLFNCGGFGMEGLFFLVVARASTAKGAMTALTFGVAFSGFAISGYNVNHLDIAPKYASILMGLSNGIGTFAGLCCPFAIDYLTKDGDGWSVVFTIAALVHLFGITFYGVFASGELQPWAEPPAQEQTVWSPSKVGYPTAETAFNESADPTTQININAGANYGAVGHVANNPFASSAASMVEEPVQPEARDKYMHGTTDDRSY
ncbi:vesicular glutamate transporter 1 [Contarinia nasturtii]|uniref:vesicular glutamate transporter 1 n=1 Tax=Contarinia nasturtii TaxID=265458 RepID=UPI0012D3B6BB|nr:vesicular glutamate transporter 1 [Contarinia nasturtii]